MGICIVKWYEDQCFGTGKILYLFLPNTNIWGGGGLNALCHFIVSNDPTPSNPCFTMKAIFGCKTSFTRGISPQQTPLLVGVSSYYKRAMVFILYHVAGLSFRVGNRFRVGVSVVSVGDFWQVWC